MLNESLCDADKQKQAHLNRVDKLLKQLFSFNRLSVDVFCKLEALREEDETENRTKFLKATASMDNFFLQDDSEV